MPTDSKFLGNNFIIYLFYQYIFKSQPATTDEIVNFVKENRGGSSLLKITKENVHSLWGERENNVVAFYSSASPAGRSFFKVLKGRARYCNATTNPMLAIDTDQFPMVSNAFDDYFFNLLGFFLNFLVDRCLAISLKN